MSRNIGLIWLASLVACASTVLASAQVSSSHTESGNPSAVAFVYVSSKPSGSKSQIQAYAASPDGTLIATVGDVFPFETMSYMAVNGQYLFATDGIDLVAFSISPLDGALTYVSTADAKKLGGDCGGPENLFLDRTGSTLYDLDYLGSECANNAYQAFSVESNGGLSYLGAATASPGFNMPLSFIGSNLYGYGSTCYHFGPQVFGYQRNQDGTLTQLNINPAMPQGKTGQEYCPSLAAADTTNDLAVVMSPIYDTNWQPAGVSQLGVYTADSSGNLTTTSNYANMPQVAVGSVNDIWAAPSGKYLAVAGSGGLQLFRFNGANPITHYTGLITKESINQVFWDNAGHLYALSPSAGKLFVFIVTASEVKQALGSPYAIASPMYLSVLPQ